MDVWESESEYEEGRVDYGKFRPLLPPTAAQLEHMIDKSGGLSVLGKPCWIWRGALNSNGYGMIRMADNTILYMHRHLYTIYKGAIPPKYDIDHLCRVRQCCNPVHLQAVTHRENMARANRTNAATRRQEKAAERYATLRRSYDALNGRQSD